jgi:hypothetical protein
MPRSASATWWCVEAELEGCATARRLPGLAAPAVCSGPENPASARKSPVLQGFCVVEAAGIEPASADAPDRASTSVVPDSDSPAGRFRDDTPAGLAILKCRAAGDWLSLGAEPDVGAAFPTSGRAGCDVASPKGYLGSDCEFVLRICSFPGGFTRPTGDLGLQLYRRTDHVETRSPPYVVVDVV